MAIRRLATSSAITGSKSSKIWDQETSVGYMDAIATAAVDSSGAATIEFSNIPSNYKHLQIRGIARSSLSSSGNNIGLYIRFNSDSTSGHYYWHELFSSGSGTASYGQTDSGIIANAHNTRTGDTANIFSASIIDVLDYADTSKKTVVRSLRGDDLNGSGMVGINSGVWPYTDQVTTVTLALESSDFVQYSHFALYGLRG